MDNTILIKLWAAGKTSTEIARELHVSRATVSGRVRRIRKLNPELVPARKGEPKPKSERKKRIKKEKLITVAEDKPIVAKHSNRYTFARPKQQMSKADMQLMLKQAVINTK